MSLNTSTSLSLAERARHRARYRVLRERIGRGLAGFGASILLLVILAIPLFLLVQWVSAEAVGDAGDQMAALLWGTAKATLAAIVVAVPLGLGAAIHVAAFASDRWRGRMRIAMELLESLPSVVIGLVAAIWLAPLLKTNLVAIALALVAMVLAVIFMARLIRVREKRRWALLPVTLIPVIAVVAFAAMSLLPDGIWQPLNPWSAVLVGVAMGLANVPLVFNSAETNLRGIAARFGESAQALGAQPLQVIRSLLLPLAWPAMLGSGLLAASRCSGETMIVLMASSNMPLMTADPFDGLRSLAADIALSLPVAAPESPAYSRLLLVTLLLFSISFVLDALARRFRNDGRRSENLA